MNPWKKATTAGLVLILVSACTTAPRVFTDFSEQAKDIDSLYLVNDVLILNDVKGKHDLIDLYENRKILDLTSNAIVSLVTARGYRVSDESIRSVGMRAGKDSQFRVFQGGPNDEPEWDSSEGANLQWAPFHMEGALEESMRDRLGTLHQRLDSILKLEDLKNQRFELVKSLGFPPGSALLINQSTGRHVPQGKKAGQMALTMLLSLGTYMLWEPSKIVHRMYLVDASDGRVLWADTYVSQDKTVNQGNIRQAIEKAFKDLPERT